SNRFDTLVLLERCREASGRILAAGKQDKCGGVHGAVVSVVKREHPRNRLCRAARVRPLKGVQSHTKWARLGEGLVWHHPPQSVECQLSSRVTGSAPAACESGGPAP